MRTVTSAPAAALVRLVATALVVASLLAVPRRRSCRRRQPRVERRTSLPRARVRRRAIRRASTGRADTRDRLPRELGACPGSPRDASSRPPGAPPRGGAEGRARRVVRPVLAHAVRLGRHRVRCGRPATGTRRSARTSSPGRGATSPRVTSSRRGCSRRRIAPTCSSARFRDFGAAPVRAPGLLGRR